MEKIAYHYKIRLSVFLARALKERAVAMQVIFRCVCLQAEGK